MPSLPHYKCHLIPYTHAVFTTLQVPTNSIYPCKISQTQVNGSSSIVKDNFRTATVLLFYILKKNRVNGSCIFSKVYCHTKFQDAKINVACAFARPPHCYYRLRKRYVVCLLEEIKAESSSGTEVALNYVNTDHTIQKLKWATHTLTTNTAEQNG